jgi:hypothetical protein
MLTGARRFIVRPVELGVSCDPFTEDLSLRRLIAHSLATAEAGSLHTFVGYRDTSLKLARSPDKV